MTSKYENQNITYSEDLKRPSTTKGSVLVNSGASNFELVTPTTNDQILTVDTSTSSGTKWSTGTSGISLGFPIPNGTTPDTGNTSYFLVLSNDTNAPCIPAPEGKIVFFSVRPNNNSQGWSNNPTTITGGTIDYTFGYIDANTDNVATNFNDYSGGPHFQVDGTDINTASTNFATYTTSLDIAVTQDQQICVKIENNLTVGSEPTWTGQNAFVILRLS